MSSFLPQGIRDVVKNKANEYIHSSGHHNSSGSSSSPAQFPGGHQSHQIQTQQTFNNSPTGQQFGPQTISAATSLTQSHSTYPRLTRLHDGSILLGYTSTIDPGTRILRVDRSTDDGNTFQPWGEVCRSSADGSDCDNLFLLEVPPSPSGNDTARVLAAFRNHDKSSGHNTHFRITVCQSHDGGKTWSFLSQAAEFTPSQNLIGVWEPFMRLGRDGQVQITYSLELAPNDQDTRLKTSHDGGQTWSEARTVTGGGEKLRDGMNGIARTTDRGRDALVMVFETTRNGTFSVECVLSSDDGQSWGARQNVFVPRSRGRNAGAPQVESFSDGSLAAVFMSDVDAERVDWPRNAAVMVAFAGPPVDGYVEWRDVRRISDLGGHNFWPGIFRKDGDGLMAVYENGGKILSHRIEMPRRR